MIQNKKAYFNYKIEDTIQAGIVLLGWELKSLDLGLCDMSGSYCLINENSIDITNLKIIKTKEASKFENTDDNRIKRLLFTKKEIKKIKQYLLLQGRTLVPVKLFRNDKGLYKIIIGFAKGKTQFDKKESIKEKDIKKYEKY